MIQGKFVGVGVGPGDPELITVKAVKILKTADIISIPKAHANKPSLALSIVKDILDERKTAPEVLELVFPMINDKKELKDAWSENANIIAEKSQIRQNNCFYHLRRPHVF